jgi:DNA-binding transcriptional ArsR family regulator
VIGDRTRAKMLDALVADDELAAGALARRVGVSASTASAHLAKLVDAGLIVGTRDGRQRVYRLAGPPVAAALEALAVIAPRRPVRSLREAARGDRLREGRTCYDHLAGRLGVELTTALIAQRVLRRRDGRYVLTRRGEQVVSELGVDVASIRAQPRAFAFPCLDSTERREHLAGALGAAFAERLFELGWVERLGAGRAAALTNPGRTELHRRFGVHLP